MVLYVLLIIWLIHGHLSSIFYCIVSLSLEWNAIGLSDQAMEALADSVITNKSIISLDLKNNKIEVSSIGYICDMIRRSALQSLDLRWNDLGANSGKTLVSALQENTNLTRLELGGNKLDEATLSFANEVINRNLGKEGRPDNEKEIIRVMFSPAKTAPNFYSSKGLDDVTQERLRVAEYRTRYDAEFALREKSERKLNDAEQQLSQERERNVEAREELLKAIENEKKVDSVSNM
jgi:hypothetical protein